jgi:hypothetical protein
MVHPLQGASRHVGVMGVLSVVSMLVRDLDAVRRALAVVVGLVEGVWGLGRRLQTPRRASAQRLATDRQNRRSDQTARSETSLKEFYPRVGAGRHQVHRVGF